MNVEDYGVPAYDELVIVANRDAIHAAKIRKFLTAAAGRGQLPARPSAGELGGVCRRAPELKTELNQQAWLQTAAVRHRSGGAG
jgi:putative hydroxymethylpyrimidine transport system substrate-binding protein